jgi:hypothetical protein
MSEDTTALLPVDIGPTTGALIKTLLERAAARSIQARVSIELDVATGKGSAHVVFCKKEL